jgi:hypothetical protein
MSSILIWILLGYCIIGFFALIYCANNGMAIDGEAILFWPILLGVVLWEKFRK